MLDQKFHLLEEKISALLETLKALRGENKSLQEENKLLRIRAQEADALSKEKVELQRRIGALEGDLSANTGKEQEIRERLRTIIEKIDAIEQMSSKEQG